MNQKISLVDFWRQEYHFGERELKAFSSINRELFIPQGLRDVAYEDRPLPLLRGKTISQPTTVMIMTAALEVQEGDKVFEVGSGSGYQAAILSKLVGKKGKVYSMEVIPELIEFATQNLKKAAIKNVEIIEGDGSKGLENEGPFDRIIITAACKEFPEPLIEQLKPEGLILGPVGDEQEQEMVVGMKEKDGRLSLHFLGQFTFTPMYGKYGFEV